MTVLIILLLVGFAAMAVLLGCLQGFTRALRHRRVSGVFVSVEKTIRRPQGPSKTLIDFPQRKSQPAKDSSRKRISGSTVALMSLVIALGSRGMPGDIRPASGKGEKAQVPGVQPTGNSR